MFRRLPPAGAPVTLDAVFNSVFSRGDQREDAQRLANLVTTLSGQKRCFFFNSGRTALLFGLQALAKQTDAFRNQVIVPAYTCYTVPAAVVRAGLKVHPVDIDPMTLDYDYDRLAAVDFSSVLAIIGDNLFGIASNWTELQSVAGQYGVFLIDDAAQAMGLTYEGCPAGSHGDFGFYSLGRGKNFTTYEGGILVTGNDRLADAIDEASRRLPATSTASQAMLFSKLTVMSLFLKPRLYWLPSMMPFLGLGETVFDPDFAVGRLSGIQVRLALSSFGRLDEFNAARKANAARLTDGLAALAGCQIPGFEPDDHPTYLRLPVLMADSKARRRLIEALSGFGISASIMYPDTVDRIPGIADYLTGQDRSFPGARTVVERLVALPTHPYLENRDIDRIIRILTAICRE